MPGGSCRPRQGLQTHCASTAISDGMPLLWAVHRSQFVSGAGSAAPSRGKAPKQRSRDGVWPAVSITKESTMRFRSEKYVAGGWRDGPGVKSTPYSFQDLGLVPSTQIRWFTTAY